MNWWYRKSLFAAILLPLSWVYKLIITLRFYLYKYGIFRTHDFDVPIVIVGNISVGGTGKTPFVAYLVKLLQQQLLLKYILNKRSLFITKLHII